MVDGKPYFVGRDVAERLGYAEPARALRQHCKGRAFRTPLWTPEGLQVLRVIDETDVFRLIMRSQLPSAERFSDWVFEEVLPTIRWGEVEAAPAGRDVVPFDFEGEPVRVVMRDGEPWFVLADVCRVLEIGNSSDVARRLDEDVKQTLTLAEGGSEVTLTTIKPAAKHVLL